MKRVVYVGLMLIYSWVTAHYSFAQEPLVTKPQAAFQKSSWQVGLQDGYGSGNLLQHHNDLHLHAGYYVANRLVVGARATWSKEWIEKYNYYDLSAGPFARYQFMASWVAPFLEASYQFGQRHISGQPAPLQTAFVSPGLSIELIHSLRVDLGYSLQFVLPFSRKESLGQPRLGLNYLFGGNR